MNNIYCNADKCDFWVELDEVHERDYGPNYTPIGNMHEYRGKCSLKEIFVENIRTRSALGYEKEVALCSNYEVDGVVIDEAVVTLMNDDDSTHEVVISGAHLYDNYCDVRPCLYNNAENDSCMKHLSDADTYVDMRNLANGNEKVTLPVCTSYSDRRIKGHIDLTRLDYPTS